MFPPRTCVCVLLSRWCASRAACAASLEAWIARVWACAASGVGKGADGCEGGEVLDGWTQAGRARLRAEDKNAHFEQLEQGLTSLALRGAALPLGSGEEGAATSKSAAAATDVRHDNNRWLCVVCMEEEKVVALLPCRHMCMCAACTMSIMASSKQCPVCRTAISDSYEMFT